MNGYLGKILRVNLTDRKISTLNTKDYEPWVGGHGMGSAIFWDLVKDKAISGFDPRNVVTIMTSPLTGTLAPGASGRTELQGIGVQSYPIEWFTRSNFGGRFGAMLKYAGWDGIVIEGKADKPVWIDIRDGDVRIKDAKRLWGLDTWKTQEEIWQEVGGDGKYGKWIVPGAADKGGRTTQRPAVLAIGPAGENLCRIACIIHDAGNASGQGGFGAVWGSKNLKAISVVGTGSIKIADPKALMDARLWAKGHYAMNPDDVTSDPQYFGMPNIPIVFWPRPKEHRPQACLGCHSGCRSRYATGQGNESSCAETAFYSQFELVRKSGLIVSAITSLLERFGQETMAFLVRIFGGKEAPASYIATDLAQKYGINAFELFVGLPYLRDLYKKGVLGPGKAIKSDLPFDRIGDIEFAEKLLRMIAYREGIGDDIAEGFFRAAKRWGRLEEDTGTGLLPYPQWGLPNHYDPRAQLEWGYGSLLGDRDVNEHDFIILTFIATLPIWTRKKLPFSAEEVAKIFSEKLIPYEGDPLMLDYSTKNMYSEHIVKLVAWHRHYTRFWKQSVLYCDLRFPDFINSHTPDRRGISGEGEPKFLNAVTGKNYNFADGMEIGKKIWTLDNAIWTLQGRHRDMVQFAEYIYKTPCCKSASWSGLYYLPGRENGKWKYISLNDRHIDRNKFEEWKTKFYKFEGWDPGTGWPTRVTLKSLGMTRVSDELKKKDRLGKG